MIEVTEKGRKITGYTIIVLMIIFGLVYHFVLQPEYRYNESAKLIAEEKYDEALYMLEFLDEDEEIIKRKYDCYYNIGYTAFVDGDFEVSVDNLSKVPNDYNAQGYLDAASTMLTFQGKWTSKEDNLEIAGWEVKYYDLDGISIKNLPIDNVSLNVNTDNPVESTFKDSEGNALYNINEDGLLVVTKEDKEIKYLPNNFTKTQVE